MAYGPSSKVPPCCGALKGRVRRSLAPRSRRRPRAGLVRTVLGGSDCPAIVGPGLASDRLKLACLLAPTLFHRRMAASHRSLHFCRKEAAREAKLGRGSGREKWWKQV